MTGPAMAPPESTPAPPSREQVQLGNRVLELDADSARTVRQAFQDLASSYGTALDQERRRVLESIGTPGWTPPPAGLEPIPGFEVPDPDLLFSNKDAWAESFARGLEARIARAQGEQTQLVQGALGAVDQELRRRDLALHAQTLHDDAMEEMIERRNLGEHRRIVQTIYNEQYRALQHLPLGVALDQIGALAEDEIAAIRGATPAAQEPDVPASAAPAPPAMLRSSRRAGAAAPSAPAAAKTLSDLIRAKQAAALSGGRAA